MSSLWSERSSVTAPVCVLFQPCVDVCFPSLVICNNIPLSWEGGRDAALEQHRVGADIGFGASI